MKEDQLQMAVARYLDYMGLLWCHVANERHTSPARGGKLKKMGVKRGVPDILIFEPRGPFVGLAIELKVGRNKPTEDQHKWLFKLTMNGWHSATCYNLDEVIEVVETHLEQGKSSILHQ